MIHVWDTTTGKETAALPVRGQRVFRLVFSPDGKRLALCGHMAEHRGTVTVWDADTGKELIFVQRNGPPQAVFPYWSIAFNPSGSHVVMADLRGQVFGFDLDGRKQLFHVDAHPYGRTPNPLQTQQIVQSFTAHAAAPTGVPVGTATHLLAAFGTARLYPAMLEPPRGEAWFTSVAYSPDGAQVATACEEHKEVKLWDAKTGKLLNTLPVGGEGYARVEFSPKGTWVATSGRFLGSYEHNPDPAIRLWDVKAGRPWRTFRASARPVMSFAFSPDETLLAAGTNDGTVTVWDVKTERVVFRYRAHERNVWRVAFTADGRQLASIDRGGHVVKFWEPAGGAESRWFPGSVSGRAVLSPDGRRVAAAAIHAERRSATFVWDADTGQELMQCGDRFESPFGVAFSPDGRRLVTAAGSDESIKLWDARTGEEILTVGRPPGWVNSVAFSADGHKIVTGSMGDIRVWDATPLKK
ncbi:MAG TPA: WD40 repeat domain-containing protein [Gemmataceae bacterium]|nr:WD40 repeat domain-containing protein [Gemmataceae bacterium]